MYTKKQAKCTPATCKTEFGARLTCRTSGHVNVRQEGSLMSQMNLSKRGGKALLAIAILVTTYAMAQQAPEPARVWWTPGEDRPVPATIEYPNELGRSG